MSKLSVRLAGVLIAIFCSGCSLLSPSSEIKFEPAKDFVRTYDQVSPEEENVIGRAVAAKILGQYKVYEGQELNDYVAQIGAVLAAASDTPETFSGYSFIILDSDEINAMAAPGGYIFITKGMLNKVKDEDELASVLAHELVHVSKRHGLQAIKPQHFGSYVAAGGVMLSAIDCSGLSQQITLAFGKAVGDIVDALMVSGYSKQQEYEADKIAAQTLQKAGYRSSGVKHVLEGLSTTKSNKGWFATHPSPQERLEQIGTSAQDSTKSVLGYRKRLERFEKIR